MLVLPVAALALCAALVGPPACRSGQTARSGAVPGFPMPRNERWEGVATTNLSGTRRIASRRWLCQVARQTGAVGVGAHEVQRTCRAGGFRARNECRQGIAIAGLDRPNSALAALRWHTGHDSRLGHQSAA